MKEAIEQRLQGLIGRTLWGARRAADMEMFQIGTSPEQSTAADPNAYVDGDYTLHVQCGWRIRGPAGIIVARRDLYYPAGDPTERLDEFDSTKKGAKSRRDERLAALLVEHAAALPIVEAVCADDVGSMRITLSQGLFLEVFPDDSLPDGSGADRTSVRI